MVIGMYMMSINIPSRKEEGFDTYSFRVRGKLFLLISGRSLPLFRRRHKDPIFTLFKIMFI
jgi:hypothetical protein